MSSIMNAAAIERMAGDLWAVFAKVPRALYRIILPDTLIYSQSAMRTVQRTIRLLHAAEEGNGNGNGGGSTGGTGGGGSGGSPPNGD